MGEGAAVVRVHRRGYLFALAGTRSGHRTCYGRWMTMYASSRQDANISDFFLVDGVVSANDCAAGRIVRADTAGLLAEDLGDVRDQFDEETDLFLGVRGHFLHRGREHRHEGGGDG